MATPISQQNISLNGTSLRVGISNTTATLYSLTFSLICYYDLSHHTCTITIYLVHPKIDYCNSILFNMRGTRTNRLQLVLNSAASAVTKIPIKVKVNFEIYIGDRKATTCI